MTAYDAIEFPFQVHNDALVTETAYLCPEGLPWGATLEVTPGRADIAPGAAAIFRCRLTLDGAAIRPGCTNDQGFRLTAWRVADDADEPWGSCFYFVRPRVRTRVEIEKVDWFQGHLSLYGRLGLDTDQPVDLDDQLPLRVRIRLGVDDPRTAGLWVTADVQPGGSFALSRLAISAPDRTELQAQAWFDRTDLLSSSRSDPVGCTHSDPTIA